MEWGGTTHKVAAVAVDLGEEIGVVLDLVVFLLNFAKGFGEGFGNKLSTKVAKTRGEVVGMVLVGYVSQCLGLILGIGSLLTAVG